MQSRICLVSQPGNSREPHILGIGIMQHLVIPMDQFPSKIALRVSKTRVQGINAAVLSFEKLVAFSLRSHTMKSPML